MQICFSTHEFICQRSGVFLYIIETGLLSQHIFALTIHNSHEMQKVEGMQPEGVNETIPHGMDIYA